MLDEGLDHSAVGSRIHEQAEQFDRHASQELRDERQDRKKKMRTGGAHEGVWGNFAGSTAAPPTTHERQIGDWLTGRPDATHGTHQDLTSKHLFWSYKNTPHAPASVFLKYLVHRSNNLDLYDDHEAGHKADVDFLKLHQMGEASHKNGHLVPDDLHNWTKRWAPSVVPELLAHRARVQGLVKQGIGLNVRDIGGEPYVALTRGLHGDLMNKEHALSSWSDQVNSGFGTHQHRAWVPVKDLWWAYDYGTPYESDTLGSEDEFLISNTGPRYEATSDDVKPSRVKSAWDANGHISGFPYAGHMDNATDDQVAEAIKWHKNWGHDGKAPMSLVQHPSAGPLSREALGTQAGSGPLGLHHAAAFTPREQVLAEASPESLTHFTNKTFKNPNLTNDDLVELGTRIFQASQPVNRQYLATGLVDSPKASTEVLEKVWDAGKAVRFPEVAERFLESPLASPRMLEEATQAVQASSAPNAEHARTLAGAVLSNPHHTEQQADRLLLWMHQKNLFTAEANRANASLDLLNKAGRIAQGNTSEELYPGALNDRGGAGQRSMVTSILQNYVGVNPSAKPEVIRELLDQGYVNAASVAHRVLGFMDLPAQLQVPVITKLTKDSGGHQYNEAAHKLADLAKSKGLTQEAVNLLAHSPFEDVRTALFKNTRVAPEMLEQAWPKGMTKPVVPTDPVALERGVVNAATDPFEHLAIGIAARKAYAQRRATEHLIKPFPAHMAKSEAAWAIELRNWVAKQNDKVGYYHPCTRAEADDAMYYTLLHPTPTEDILDGEAVFAHRASPEFVKKWQKTATPDQALVYFETTVEPEQAGDGRFYWTSIVPLEHAHVVEPDTSMEKHEELTGLGRVLAKMHGPVTFPRLGVPDDRRESDIITDRSQLATKARLFAQQDVNELKGIIGASDKSPKDKTTSNPKAVAGKRGHTVHLVNESKFPGLASEFGGGYVLAPSNWAEHKMSLKSTKPHEDMHLLLNRVQAKYGREGRKKLVANLFEAIPSHLKDTVMQFAADRSGKGTRNPMSGLHEEWLTYLMTYLNESKEREQLHADPKKLREHHTKMKQAYAAARAAAEVATPAWTQHYRPWLVRANNPAGTQVDFADTRAPFGPYAHTTENLWEGTTRPQPRLWTGQFVRKSEPQPEGAEMFKSLKGLVLAGALALPGVTSSAPAGPIEGPPNPTPAQMLASQPVEPLHPHLMAIRHLESADGTLLNHEKNSTDFNTAWGELGLKPVTAHDVWLHSPNLQKKYPGLENPNDFTKAFKTLPGLHNGCANRHWNTLLKDFNGDQKRAAFGWRWGRTAAHNATPEAVEGSDYVQNFAMHPKSGVKKAAPVAAPVKVAHPFHPKKRLHKNLDLDNETLEPGEVEAALFQLGHNPEVDKTLKAAQFLTGRQVRVDEDAFALALQIHDGDIERAALNAVGLTDSDKNLKALKAVLRLGSWDEQTPVELTKAEASPEVPSITSVEPAVPGAEDTADAVGRAVTAGLLHPLKLKGKHAAGATAAKDPQTGHIVLLKPGSGKQSPAAGARDDSSSQSAREAAFWHIAEACGLGNYYPRADLLLVNAQEWAAMSMLGPKWKSLDEYNRSEDGRGREVLTPYLKRGDVHRLAVMDWVLGNPDSHGQNIMTYGQAVALIDHGSAFAGPNFKPGLDTKSFIPYYLRLFGSRGLAKLPPEERVKTLPVLDAHTDSYLRDWVDDIKPGTIDGIMKEYGIGEVAREAVLNRLHDLQSYEGDNLSAYLNAHWAGVAPEEMKKSEPLAKHSAESWSFFPRERMTENAEGYEWPKPFDHPEVVAQRQKDAVGSYMREWVRKLEDSPAYKKWEEAHGGPARWEADPTTGTTRMLSSPEVKEADDLLAAVRHDHGGAHAAAIEWANRVFPGSWGTKHAAGLHKVVRESVKGDDDHFTSERRFWLGQVRQDTKAGRAAANALRRATPPDKVGGLNRALRDGDYRMAEWMEANLPVAKQKKLIQAAFPKAFTKSKEYQDYDVKPHPAIVNGIQNGVISMNFPVSRLPQLTRAGKYLNLHETGSGMGETDTGTRGEHEEGKFGIDMDTSASYRPVYGALNWATRHQPAHAHFGAAPQYGEAWLELKPSVKERASYTPGDSFEVEAQQVYSHQNPDVLAHAFQQAQPSNKHAIIHGKPHDRWSDYIEAQIFGGVDFKEDVRALHLGPAVSGMRREKERGEKVSPYDEAIEQARAFGAKHNVPVYLHGGDPAMGYSDDGRGNGGAFDNSLREAPANAFKVTSIFQPGDKYKPKKGVKVEQEPERREDGYGEDYDGDSEYEDDDMTIEEREAAEKKPDPLAAFHKPEKAMAVKMREHYSKHIPKLTEAYNDIKDPNEKAGVEKMDSDFWGPMDAGKESAMVDHPFAAWARTVVPEFGEGFKGEAPKPAEG